MVRTQYPLANRQQFGQGGRGTGRVPGCALPVGEVVPGREGVGVIGAQYPLPYGDQLREDNRGLGRLAAVSEQDSQVVACGEGVGVLEAEGLMLDRQEFEGGGVGTGHIARLP